MILPISCGNVKMCGNHILLKRIIILFTQIIILFIYLFAPLRQTFEIENNKYSSGAWCQVECNQFTPRTTPVACPVIKDVRFYTIIDNTRYRQRITPTILHNAKFLIFVTNLRIRS